MAKKTGSYVKEDEQGIVTRLERIEQRLFGNGDSLIEKVTRLEECYKNLSEKLEGKQRELVQSAMMASQKQIERTLEAMLQSSMRSGKLQLYGLWIAVLSLIIGFIFTKVLGIP